MKLILKKIIICSTIEEKNGAKLTIMTLNKHPKRSTSFEIYDCLLY